MNKEILELLEFVKLFNKNDVLEDEFNAFASNFNESRRLSLEDLLQCCRDEVSYWEAN